jgi:hypothetical protein
MIATPIYNEFIDFLAGGFSPQQIIAYRPSDKLQNQVFDLISKEKNGSLTKTEQFQLTYYLQLEHIIRMAKARARKHL